MSQFKQYPFLRLLIPLISGIVLGLNYQPAGILLYLIITALLVLFSVFLSKISKYHFRHWPGMFFYVAIFTFGNFSVKLNTPVPKNIYEKKIISIAVVEEPPIEKLKSVSVNLNLISVQDSLGEQIGKTKIMAYIEKDSTSLALEYGDVIIFSGTIQKLSNSGNPNEFDFKSFLERKGITGRVYLKAGMYKRTDDKRGNFLFRLAYSLRDKLISIYSENNISGQELAVLSALTLGERSDIEDSLEQAYSASGAMHVLSVSGLHVGIVFIVLNFVLSFLDKFKPNSKVGGRLIKSLIIIIFLWFFALLTGLSPSVRRAALMFTFFLIATVSRGRNNTYNSIAASAFILLIINPFLLLDIGFLLSYFAVVSIIYYQPKIYALLNPKNKILDKIWALITVSLAAQIGTLPISFLFFHQFPTWFLLTNIIVVPLSSAIVYAAVLLLVFNFVPYLNIFLAYILNKSVFLLNKTVVLIENLPVSVIKNITFGTNELVLTCLLIFSLSFYFIHRRIKVLHIFLFIIFVFFGLDLYENMSKSDRKQFFVYNVSGESVLNFILNDNNYVLTDTVSAETRKKIKFAASGNWSALDVEEFELIEYTGKFSELGSNLFISQDNILFAEKKIMLLNNREQIEFSSVQKRKIDFLILSGNVYLKIDEILELFEVGQIIADSSNKLNKIETWKSDCLKSGIKFHSVIHQGAFCLSL